MLLQEKRVMKFKESSNSGKESSNEIWAGTGFTGKEEILKKEDVDKILSHHLKKLYGATLNGVIDLETSIKDEIIKRINLDNRFKKRINLSHLGYAGENLNKDLTNLFENNKTLEPQGFILQNVINSQKLVLGILKDINESFQ